MGTESIGAAGLSALTWIGIGFCISQSAMFSGLNIAFFSFSRLRLEVEASSGNAGASRILKMRQDSNFLLATILWGNVGINVLLTLLTNSVMAGVAAFLFSTVLITFIGEIVPQAYFSRHALRMASLLSPILQFYQFMLFPIAKPVAIVLDRWLGREGIHYYREHDLREVIRKHIATNESDVDLLEGLGALNFLNLDDLTVAEEGETLDPLSIVQLPFDGQRPIFPDLGRTSDDGFLRSINESGKGWVVLVDPAGEPQLVCDADRFLREALFQPEQFSPLACCHRPILVREGHTRLGDVIPKFNVHVQHPGDDVIDNDVILMWGAEKRLITGSDILGRLLAGTTGQRPDALATNNEAPA